MFAQGGRRHSGGFGAGLLRLTMAQVVVAVAAGVALCLALPAQNTVTTSLEASWAETPLIMEAR